MKPFRYHILLALAGEPVHGAEIRRRVEEDSGGGVTLYPATLYGTLDELTDEGWAEEVDAAAAAPDQVRWRFYRLTVEGRRALEEETKRLEAVVGRARTVLETAQGA